MSPGHVWGSCATNFTRRTLPNDLPLLLPQSERVQAALTEVLAAHGDLHTISVGDMWSYRPQVDYYTRLATSPAVKTVCEVGVWAGRSSVLWLTSNPTAHLYQFSLVPGGFGPPAIQFLRETFPHRFFMHEGLSGDVIPAFVRGHSSPDGTYTGPVCDIVHIDGDHSYLGLRTDIASLLPMMACHTLVVMDDVCDVHSCHCQRVEDHSLGCDAAVGLQEAIEARVLQVVDSFFDPSGVSVDDQWGVGQYSKGWVVARPLCPAGRPTPMPSTPMYDSERVDQWKQLMVRNHLVKEVREKAQGQVTG